METLLEKIKKSMHKKKAKDYDSWASEMMKDSKKVEEALTAKQKKHIDVNDNEKIDAEDFEMLRKKKKQVKEEFDNSFKDELNEVLSKDATASDYIKDFVNSDNPKFKGKSKKERIKMALGAYYSKQRNEEHVQEASKAELLEAKLSNIANDIHNVLGSHVGPFNRVNPTGLANRGYVPGAGTPAGAFTQSGYKRQTGIISFVPNKKMDPDKFEKHVNAVKNRLNINSEKGLPGTSKLAKPGSPSSGTIYPIPGTDHVLHVPNEPGAIQVGTRKAFTSVKKEPVQEASKAELAAMAAAAMKSGIQVKKVQPGERTIDDKKLYKAMKKGEKVKGDDESYIDQKRLEGISASFKGKPTGKRKVKEEVDQEEDTKKN